MRRKKAMDDASYRPTVWTEEYCIPYFQLPAQVTFIQLTETYAQALLPDEWVVYGKGRLETTTTTPANWLGLLPHHATVEIAVLAVAMTR